MPEYAPAAAPRFAGANVVLISVDTERRDHLAPYGAKLDTAAASRLAREGVVFVPGGVRHPPTLPSHSSIFTGLYPPHNGVRDNAGFVLGKNVTTLAERLHEHGYQTAAVVGSYVVAARFGLAQGFETYDDAFDYSEIERRSLTELERPAGQVVDRALDWLHRERRADRPFYLWVHLYDPHDPYNPPEEFRRRAPTPYAGEVLYADSQVGRLLDALDAVGLRQRDARLLRLRPRRVAGRARRGDPRDLPVRVDARRADDHRPAVGGLPRSPAGGDARQGTGAPRRRHADRARPRRAARAGGARRHDPVAGDRPRGGPLPPAPTEAPPDAVAGPVSYAESYFARFHHGWSELVLLETGRWRSIRAPQPELYDRRTDPKDSDNVYARHRDVAATLTAQLESMNLLKAGGRAHAGQDRPPGSRAPAGARLRPAPAPARRRAKGALADPKDKVPLLQELQRAQGTARRGAAGGSGADPRGPLAQGPRQPGGCPPASRPSTSASRTTTRRSPPTAASSS